MSPSLHIALRFISQRKRSIFVSLLGITCGVALFICTQAQTQGFEKFYIQTVLGTKGAVLVSDRFQARYSGDFGLTREGVVSVEGARPRRYQEGISNPEQMIRAIREFSDVISCTPVLEDNATITTNDFGHELARLLGIDLDSLLLTTDLRQELIAGDLGDFRAQPRGVLLGSLLANNLRTKVGDNISIAAATGEPTTFRVCGIVQTGDNLLDERRAYVHRRAAQNLLGRPGEASYVIVKMRDPDRAPQLAERLEEILQHRARSWQERAQGNLQIFHALRISAAVTVAAIIALAGFGIFNVLTLMILDKMHDIAILRSMGYRRGDISAIFLWQGLVVAALGSIFGCGFGALLTYIVSRIPVRVRGFFSTDHFVMEWTWRHYVAGIVIAFIAVLVASFFPSRRASRLAPVAVLRGASQ
jgi:lipoprotein-releasing system permease protein